MIVQLAHAVSSALECTDFFDVYDEKDAEEEGRKFTPSVCKKRFVEGIILCASMVCMSLQSAFLSTDKKLSKLARKYGKACNGFLKFYACSYQAVILQQDCTTGEQIVATTDGTQPPTDSTRQSVATIQSTTPPISDATTYGSQPPTDGSPTSPQSVATTQSTTPPISDATKVIQLTTTGSVATIKETTPPSVTTSKGTQPPTKSLLTTPTGCQPTILNEATTKGTHSPTGSPPSNEAATKETRPPTGSQPTTPSNEATTTETRPPTERQPSRRQ